MVTQILTFTKSSGVWETTPAEEILNAVNTADTTSIEYINTLGTDQYTATHDIVSETVYTITRAWLDLDAYATYTALNSVNNNIAALNAVGISITSETID
tara:strand:- start:88 stop:387 length:300 start_codon:yes stop_codon:yes gene_type:complete